MPDALRRNAAIAALSLLTLGVGIGGTGSTPLTYHEALVAQGAREMLRRGDWLVPTVNGAPWLEKPPLAHWLVRIASAPFGDVDETTARLPSVLAGLAIGLAVADLAARRFGPTAGTLAGLVQATTYWTVLRGRLADADVLLAAIVAGVFVCFDRLRSGTGRRVFVRRLFFALLGATALAKGIGFGAALALAGIGLVLVWDRDRELIRELVDPVGWAIAALIALAWPLRIVAPHPEVLSLWTAHVSDRFSDRPSQFAGGPWWTYAAAALGLTLPWTPFALSGLIRSSARARTDRRGADRLLVAWAVVPLVVLSFATVKNAHYAIHALPPWSVWAATSLVRIGARIEAGGRRPGRAAAFAFGSVGIAYVVAFAVLAPRRDERGREWRFYADAGRRLAPGETLAILHDDWDRLPYPTPFGPVPHDLAVRLFYLRPERPARVYLSPDELAADPPPGPFAVVARERDRDALGRIGSVEPIARGPEVRWDRVFSLYRIDPGARTASRPSDGGAVR